MKNRFKSSLPLTALLAGSLLLAVGHPSVSADVVQLTGGDPSGGLTLAPADVVYAYNTNIDALPAGFTFQGVSFTPITSSDTAAVYTNSYPLSGAGATSTGAGFTNGSSPDTQDKNLLTLVNSGMSYFGDTSGTITITGLSDAANYQVDILSCVAGIADDTRSFTVGYNGGSAADTVSNTSPDDGIFAVEDTVESTGGGQITVNFTQGNDGPYFNDVIVSKIPATTPEPATYALLGLGGLALLLVNRRRAGKV
jgi:hypothetical protein